MNSLEQPQPKQAWCKAQLKEWLDVKGMILLCAWHLFMQQLCHSQVDPWEVIKAMKTTKICY